MEAGELYFTTQQEVGNTGRGKILLIDDDAKALEARSASLQREGHSVRAYSSFPEGLSRLESEHFDLIVVKLKEVPSLEAEGFWSVSSRSPAGSLSSFWHAATIGLDTWLWRTWELWTH
jgi:response regulator RpfG family c-di-GMP phosphodiesterase